MPKPVVELTRIGRVSVPLPTYATPGSAGLDLCAALENPVAIAPGERRLIPSGLRIALPAGYEAQVRPRSGLALKAGISIVNTPGTIDEDYRGEVSILLINHGHEPFVVEPLARIAQLIVAPVVQVELREVAELDETSRGSGGYGSTGV